MTTKAYKDGPPAKCPWVLITFWIWQLFYQQGQPMLRWNTPGVETTRSRRVPACGMPTSMTCWPNALMERLFSQQNGETSQAALTFLGAGNGQNLKRRKNPLALEGLKTNKETDENTPQKEGDKKTAEQKLQRGWGCKWERPEMLWRKHNPWTAGDQQRQQTKGRKKNAPPKAKKGPRPQPRVRLRRVQWVSVQRKIHSFPGTHVPEPTHLDHCTARRLTKRSNGERMGLKRYGNARWNTLRPFLSEGILAAARPA